MYNCINAKESPRGPLLSNNRTSIRRIIYANVRLSNIGVSYEVVKIGDKACTCVFDVSDGSAFAGEPLYEIEVKYDWAVAVFLV